MTATGKIGVRDKLEHFTNTGDGVWAVDLDHRILLWNQAAEDLLGYKAREALGQTCHQLLGGRDPEGQPFCRTRCSVQECTRQGQVVEAFNVQVRRRDGGVAWINVSVVAVSGGLAKGKDVTLVHLSRQIARGEAWPPPLRIRLLGPIGVERADGSRVDGLLWRRAKVRALLAVLALARGQPLRREQILDTLWPDLEYGAALRSLNTTVYNLRRALEPALERGADSNYVHYEGECYLLDGGRIHWLDVEAFETRITRARRQHDPGQARDLYGEALALYRGDFLADLEADRLGHWMERQRQRLRELYLSALEELAALHVRQGKDREASELYLKALALDRCRESALQSLMRLALRRGQRAAALAHCRRLERALWHDLGILPGQETQLLCQKARAEG